MCLIVDAFSRRIVGWRVAAHMRTQMVIDALETARRSRGARLDGLAVHSDASSVFDGAAAEALAGYGRIVGLDLSEAADGSAPKVPSGGKGIGKSPVDQGKSEWK